MLARLPPLLRSSRQPAHLHLPPPPPQPSHTPLPLLPLSGGRPGQAQWAAPRRRRPGAARRGLGWRAQRCGSGRWRLGRPRWPRQGVGAAWPRPAAAARWRQRPRPRPPYPPPRSQSPPDSTPSLALSARGGGSSAPDPGPRKRIRRRTWPPTTAATPATLASPRRGHPARPTPSRLAQCGKSPGACALLPLGAVARLGGGLQRGQRPCPPAPGADLPYARRGSPSSS